MFYLTLEEQTRRALLRKRRMRLIHKWRHGLAHTVQPKHGDRAKKDIIGFWSQRDAARYVEMLDAMSYTMLKELFYGGQYPEVK